MSARRAVNILVMGADTREGEGNDIEAEGPTDERSDTTILMHVSADRKHAYGVSLPRDASSTGPTARSAARRSPARPRRCSTLRSPSAARSARSRPSKR